MSPLGLQSNDGFGINEKKCLNLVSERKEIMDRVRLVGFQQISTQGLSQGAQRDPDLIAVREKRRPKQRVKKCKKMEKERLGQLLKSNLEP